MMPRIKDPPEENSLLGRWARWTAAPYCEFKDDRARLLALVARDVRKVAIVIVLAIVLTNGNDDEGGNAQTTAAPTASPDATGQRDLFDAALGRREQAAIYPRAAFTPGSHITGPSLICEDETTIVLPASRDAIALEDGCIDIHLRQSRADTEAAHG